MSKAAPEGAAFARCNSLKLNLKVETFFHATSADLHAGTIRNAGPLKVWILATVATRVELCSTNRVGVLSNNFRTFCAERTDVCHKV